MRLLGFTEEITQCGCCGKSELKGTYAFETSSGIQYYGSTCAKNMGITEVLLLQMQQRQREKDTFRFRQSIMKSLRSYKRNIII